MVLSKTGRQVWVTEFASGHWPLRTGYLPIPTAVAVAVAGGLCGLAEDYRRNVKYIRLVLFVDLCGE